MKKYLVLSAVTALSLTMGACSIIVPKSASTSETKPSVETVATVDSEASTATIEAATKTDANAKTKASANAGNQAQDSKAPSVNPSDKQACMIFSKAAKKFKKPTVNPQKDLAKYMEALKPLTAPAYLAAEKANDADLKEAFKAFGNLCENGVKTDPKIAADMGNTAKTIIDTCNYVGVNTDGMLGK